MPNIPYKNVDNYQPKELLDAVLARRGARGLLNLDRMLLHSPPVAEGWLAFLTAIRQQCQLSGRDRELVILRTARIHGDVHYDALTIEQGATVDGRFAPRRAADDAAVEGSEPRLILAN